MLQKLQKKAPYFGGFRDIFPSTIFQRLTNGDGREICREIWLKYILTEQA